MLEAKHKTTSNNKQWGFEAELQTFLHGHANLLYKTRNFRKLIFNLYLFYHSLTHSWSRVLLEKPPIFQLLKNFPAFYGT
jgi:hypothetical protein